MRCLLSLIVFLLFIPVTFAQTAGSDYKIYSTSLKKEVTVADIVNGTTPGQVLIFGEQHDDAIGHLLEKNIFEALNGRYGKDLILAMEMFHRDVQYIVNEYLAGQISEKNFIKEARAWDTYKTDYRPAVEFAKEKQLQVVAANAPSRYTNLVTRKGLDALNGLDKEVKKKYIAPLPVDTLTGIYYDKFMEAMGGHSTPGMNLYQSQNFWDATMSYSIAEAMKKHKKAVVFQMNGRFHSEYHSGLAGRLERVYKKKVTTISCFSPEDFDMPDWAKYAPLADYIIVTKAPLKKEKTEE
jgi:uncharacterized iron-regulated protein